MEQKTIAILLSEIQTEVSELNTLMAAGEKPAAISERRTQAADALRIAHLYRTLAMELIRENAVELTQ